MTLADIKNSIFRRTKTDANSFPAADMVIALNAANERAHSLIRHLLDSFLPTDWTSSDLSTGTATPKFDALFHDLIPLYVSYDRAVEMEQPNANGFMLQIQRKEVELLQWYGIKNYQVFTITIASPGVITKQSHGLYVGDRVMFTTSGALPTGLSANTFYYVVGTAMTDDAFTVSATSGGTAINTSGSQSGTHYFSSNRPKRLGVNNDSNQ